MFTKYRPRARLSRDVDMNKMEFLPQGIQSRRLTEYEYILWTGISDGGKCFNDGSIKATRQRGEGRETGGRERPLWRGNTPQLKPKETEGEAGSKASASSKASGSRSGLARRGKGREVWWGQSPSRSPSLESGHYGNHLGQVLSRGPGPADVSF